MANRGRGEVVGAVTPRSHAWNQRHFTMWDEIKDCYFAALHTMIYKECYTFDIIVIIRNVYDNSLMRIIIVHTLGLYIYDALR